MLSFKSPKNIIYGGGGRSPEIRFLETLERERERRGKKKNPSAISWVLSIESR